MIEINLIPDVKQELISAQRVRSTVISIAIVAGIAAVGVMVLLAIYVFGAQQLRSTLADNSIKSENEKLSKVADLGDALTIQNQLTKLSELHDSKKIDSRLFDVLSAIVPPAPNNVAISKIAVDAETSTITIDAQADNGFPALEVFRKTVAATKFEYSDAENKRQSVQLADNISDSNRSYGEDSSGKKVLRFTMSFTYPEALFARSSLTAAIVGPTRTNVTDSFVGVPSSLFTQRAADTEGEGN